MMKLTLNQTISGLSAEYELVHKEAVISKAAEKNNLTFGGAIRFRSFPDNKSFTLCYQPARAAGNITRKREEKEVVSYVILDEDGLGHGEICQQYRKVSRLVSYDYLRLTFDGVTCLMYTVGMGKDGIKYPIYDGSDTRQIALIEKDTVVHNNLDQYRIAAVDEKSALLAYICGLYLDSVFYARRGEAAQKTVQKTYSKTTIRELMEKYNPAFISETEE